MSHESNHLLWRVFFYAAGLSTLFVWNSIMSLNAYWESKFGANVSRFYGFTFMGGEIFNFICFNIMRRIMSFRLAIILCPILVTIGFYVELIVGEYIDYDKNPTLKLSIFLAMIFTQGLLNNFLQLSLGRFVFNFSGQDITSYNSGTAVAGFLCASISLILAFTEQSILSQFIVYLVCVTILLIGIIVIFCRYHFISFLKANFLQVS